MFYFALYVGKAEGFRKADTTVTGFRSHGSQNKTRKKTSSADRRHGIKSGRDSPLKSHNINGHRDYLLDTTSISSVLYIPFQKCTELLNN